MAKKQQNGGNLRCAVNKKALKNARAQEAQARAREEQRREDREKSRRMGSVFLASFLALIALFCLYTLIHTLFFPAASLSELRSDLLFVSLVALPYLIAAGAVLIHRLNQKRRSAYSERGRRLSGALYLLVLLGCFALFGVQLLTGPRDASQAGVCTQTVQALEESGLPVTKPETIPAFRSLLEWSLETELDCGRSLVLLHAHTEGSGLIPAAFLKQAERDYGEYRDAGSGCRIWEPRDTGGTFRAAVALSGTGSVTVWELQGPREELERLIGVLSTQADTP